MPGLALSPVFPQSGASPPGRCCVPGASTEPVLPHGCRGTRGTISSHTPRTRAHGPVPMDRVQWQESTWALADAAPATCSTPKLSAPAMEAQGCGQKACQENACHHCILHLELTLATPRRLLQGGFISTIISQTRGAVQAQQPLSLQSTGINKILLAA